MEQNAKCSSLFGTFFKIGLFTFGGGYAMIPIIQSECVEKRSWITEDELLNVTAIAESTPGPIAINCATYTGYAQRGIRGAIAATAGVVTPSLIIIYIISMFLDDFLKIRIIANAFRGIKVAVAILIISAAIKMIKQISKKSKHKKLSVAIIAISLIAMFLINIFSFKFSVFYIVIIFALVGFVTYLLEKTRGDKA